MEAHRCAGRIRWARRLRRRTWKRPLPATSTMRMRSPASFAARGSPAARMIEGRARVISEEDAETGNPMEDFRDGDIIVATMINPAWLPYFSRAGGFVSEVGGWLSHPAILAREYDVPMIVGTQGIGGIADGSVLRLHLDGRIEIVTPGVSAKDVAAA